MVILKFTHKFGLERKPFGIAVVARPAAGTSGSFSGKAGPRAASFDHEWFQDLFQLLSLFAGKAGTEADMIQLTAFVVQAKQKRTDFIGWLFLCGFSCALF